jgi:hypothetical protein
MVVQFQPADRASPRRPNRRLTTGSLCLLPSFPRTSCVSIARLPMSVSSSWDSGGERLDGM